MTDIEARALLSRRRLLGLLGAGAATAVPVVSLLGRDTTADAATTSSLSATSTAVDACSTTDTEEQEVGPFYVAEGVVRSDITSGEDGVPLTFTITLTTPDTCEPLIGAAVDVWHASAEGIYSDESSEDTIGETFLRGIQITDSAGQVTFTSIYPGWYAGRSNHIHSRVYTGGTVSGTSYDYSDATLIHTGQMFFDPDLNTTVASVSPYSSNKVTRTTNADDRVYTEQGGASVLSSTTGDTTDGYISTVTFDVTGTSVTTTTPDSTSLSMAVSHASLVYGSEVTLSGTLTDTSASAALSGQKIVITSTSPTGATKKTTTTTGSNGTWTTTFRPAATASYQASYAATSSSAAAKSAAHTVTVHRRVTVGHVSSTASAAHPVTISGRITPAAPKVRVGLHQIVDGGKRTLTQVRTDAAGKWSMKVHLGKGKHRLYAHVPATDTVASGTSRTLTVRRS